MLDEVCERVMVEVGNREKKVLFMVIPHTA